MWRNRFWMVMSLLGLFLSLSALLVGTDEEKRVSAPEAPPGPIKRFWAYEGHLNGDWVSIAVDLSPWPAEASSEANPDAAIALRRALCEEVCTILDSVGIAHDADGNVHTRDKEMTYQALRDNGWIEAQSP